MPNPYDDLLQQDTAERARTTMMSAVDHQPDTEAKLQGLAKQYGMPVDAVRLRQPEVEKRARLDALDYDTLAKQYPMTAGRLTDPAFAAVAHDDVDNMSQFERKLKQFGGGAVEGLGGMVSGFGVGLDIAQRNIMGAMVNMLPTPRGGEMTPEAAQSAVGPLMGTDWRYAGGQAKALARDSIMIPSQQQTFADKVAAGLGQVGAQIPASVLLGAAPLYLQGLDAMDEKVGKDNASQGAKDLAILGGAAVTGITEKWALDKLLGPVATPMKGALASALMRIGVAGASEGAQEATENLAQDLLRQALTNPDAPIQLGEAMEAGSVGAAVGAIVRTVVESGLHIRARGARGEQAAQAAEANGQVMADVVKLAEASKLRERSPENFATFAQSLAEGGVENLHIEAKTLMQSPQFEAIAQALPSVAEQIQEAAVRGGDIVVPTQEFLSAVPGSEFAQELVDLARTSEDAMSPAEARTFMQERGTQLQAQIEEAVAAQQESDTWRQSRDQLQADFVTQLNTVKRFTPDANEQYASLMANFYAVQASRLGTTPQELAQRYGLVTRADGVAGGRKLDQSGDQSIGPFGQVFEQFKGDAQGAIAHLRQAQGGEAVGALNHPELGDIDLVWGEEGTNQHDGYGLAKLIRWHPEVVDNLQEIVASMPVVKRSANRAMLESTDHKGGVRLQWDGVRKHWLLTAFRKEEGRGGGAPRTDTSTEDLQDGSLSGHPSDASVEQALKTFYQSARGSISLPDDLTSSPAIISLFKGADLSTFIHESGHFFLEVQMDLAARIQAQIDAGASVTDGERGIVEDARKILDWFDVKGGDGIDPLTEWGGLDLEAKRPMHEQWARGFEAYSFEGNAPSIELQGAFQKFRTWLVSIYKNLKALNVELTDDVRGVMDRMLASEQAIEEAQTVRAMGPLFKTADAAGMTPDEFAAYHAAGGQATQEAVDYLQARGLRDMKWLANAKNRKLKELQKQVAEMRREVRTEVRAEVMRQPVYRAWQFLTGRVDPMTQEETPELIAYREALAKWTESRGLTELDAREAEKAALLTQNPDVKGLERGQLIAKNKKQIDINVAQAMLDWEKDNTKPVRPPTSEPQGPDAALYGKLDADELTTRYGAKGWQRLADFKMTRKAGGLPSDIVAEASGFGSGDEMVKALLEARPPQEMIEAMTDQRMLERFGDLGTPDGLQRAVDVAIHNEARARFVATEIKALERGASVREPGASGRSTVDVLAASAKAHARRIIGMTKVRDLKPGRYTAAEARAARAAEKAMIAGKTEDALAEKRNQLINLQMAKATMDARDEVDRAVRYLKRFSAPGTLPADHYERILMLLEKFDLRSSVSQKSLENKSRFSTWVRAQLEAGEIPPNFEVLLSPSARQRLAVELQSRTEEGDLVYADEDKQAELIAQFLDESPVRSYKEVTFDELVGLIDTVKQIEHIGRRTKRVLTDRANREFDTVVGEIKSNAAAVAGRTNRVSADVRSSNTNTGRLAEMGRGWFFSHIKAAALIEVIDGGQAGPMWSSLVRSANSASDAETLEVAAVHDKVVSQLRGLQEQGKITDSPVHFPSIGRALNRQARIAMAMNMGNASNIQRLLGGDGWTMDQIEPVLATLTAKDWTFVQSMWDLYEEQRPAWSDVYRKINGVSPELIDAQPLTVHTVDGQTLHLRGGYTPVAYDPRGSGKAKSFADEKQAKQSLRAARVASTVNKSFTKARVDEVTGRPLLLSLDALINGMQDTIHYTHWQPWIIDANRIIKALDPTLRKHYGAEAVTTLRDWIADTAAGVQAPRDAAERLLAWTAKNVSFATLAMNVMNAAQQITGITSSMVTLGEGGSAVSGAVWMARGLSHVMRDRTKAYHEAVEKSAFMRKRATTMLRDLNEAANVVQDQGRIADFSDKYGYIMTQMMQVTVDLPTWWAAYHKAGADRKGFLVRSDGSIDDSMAIALADQAVIDAQGGGQVKDLARYERSKGVMRLFTGFMSYMNTMLNQNYRILRSERSAARKTLDLLLVNHVPVVMMVLMRALLTPGGDDEEDAEALAKKVALEQVSFLFGQMVGIREVGQIFSAAAGEPFAGRYGGPVGARAASDLLRLSQQIGQGEVDVALAKAAVSFAGVTFRLPSVQINRAIDGSEALSQDDTDNPAALLTGYQGR